MKGISVLKDDGVSRGKFDSSEVLDGAISSDEGFLILRDSAGSDGIADFGNMSAFAPSSFDTSECQAFVDENGAVAGAYKMNEIEFEKNGEAILDKYREAYPDYKFEIKPGEFPIDVDGGVVEYTDPKAEMSDYIVYITDYKDHLKTGKRM